jgi:(S)-2-hydroxyglutarate dehydrogenase
MGNVAYPLAEGNRPRAIPGVSGGSRRVTPTIACAWHRPARVTARERRYEPLEHADLLIIGGGIVGIALALEARRRDATSRIVLLEKEAACGLHASGRNSGVLHAGFYYTADSLKARLCRDGNRQLTEYCLERGLRIRRCGKLVVARNEAEHAGIDELLQRGRANGVELVAVTEDEALEIEPRVRTAGRAIWSPTTASVDPREVVASLLRDAVDSGVHVRTRTAYLQRQRTAGFASTLVRTSHGTIEADYVVNAAGLYADRIARDWGFARDLTILPFRGLYLYPRPGAPTLGVHVYPVPNLGNPWLGVHWTVTVGGEAKIGPTATPAFWREHYGGLGNFRATELLQVAAREAALLLRDRFGFRRIALQEIRKQFRRKLAREAGELVSGVRASDYPRWGPPGIRAQLLDTRTGRLEMDFRWEGDDRSFHVLNAVSPAFTSALPFAKFLFDRIASLRGGGHQSTILG